MCGRIPPCCGFIPSTRQGFLILLPNKQWDWCIGWQQSQSLCRKKTVLVLILHTGELQTSPFLQGNVMPRINTHGLLLPSAYAMLFSVCYEWRWSQPILQSLEGPPHKTNWYHQVDQFKESNSNTFAHSQGFLQLLIWIRLCKEQWLTPWVPTQEGTATLPSPHGVTSQLLSEWRVQKEMKKPRKIPGRSPQS